MIRPRKTTQICCRDQDAAAYSPRSQLLVSDEVIKRTLANGQHLRCFTSSDEQFLVSVDVCALRFLFGGQGLETHGHSPLADDRRRVATGLHQIESTRMSRPILLRHQVMPPNYHLPSHPRRLRRIKIGNIKMPVEHPTISVLGSAIFASGDSGHGRLRRIPAFQVSPRGR